MRPDEEAFLLLPRTKFSLTPHREPDERRLAQLLRLP